jgi:hypothetical protein
MTRHVKTAGGAALLLLLVTGSGRAQTTANPFTAFVTASWGGLKKNLAASAALLPEADYGFKPAATVRTFGQIIGHLANDHYLMCSAAKGEKNPATTDFEKVTGKAALVKALNDSITYCDAVYGAMNDQVAIETIELFGGKHTKLGVLNINLSHSSEHYGNLVTYLRIRGLVPPSSASGQ